MLSLQPIVQLKAKGQHPCQDKSRTLSDESPRQSLGVADFLLRALAALRVYKELMPMKKDQVDLVNAVVWIPDSKTPNGIAEIPLPLLATQAFQHQLAMSGDGPFLFPSDQNPSGHQKTLKTVWRKTLRRAGVPYFRIYDLRSTYATRLSAGGVADEWVTQLLRQGDSKVFKKYSQMKREALKKINRRANEMALESCTAMIQ
jgi:integrase